MYFLTNNFFEKKFKEIRFLHTKTEENEKTNVDFSSKLRTSVSIKFNSFSNLCNNFSSLIFRNEVIHRYMHNNIYVEF